MSPAKATMRATPADPIHQELGSMASTRPGRRTMPPRASTASTIATIVRAAPTRSTQTSQQPQVSGLWQTPGSLSQATKQLKPSTAATKPTAKARLPSRLPRYQRHRPHQPSPLRHRGGLSAHIPVTSSATSPTAEAQSSPHERNVPSQPSAIATPRRGPPTAAANGLAAVLRRFEARGHTKPARPMAVSHSIAGAPAGGASRASAANTPDRRTNAGRIHTR
mmetsp:Transcript_145191/g.404640  ORF Transcript_145191/g.404640 Transcript_145191/m.404640 type:complete len:222 (+) Transcript_145191:743-1408(+)